MLKLQFAISTPLLVKKLDVYVIMFEHITDMMQDAYIDRCIEDLVKIYLPWVVVSNHCSMQECVEKSDRTSRLILSIVCATFIKRKSSSPHQHCVQVC